MPPASSTSTAGYTNLDKSDANPIIPTVVLALTESNKTAHVAPGDTGVVTFSGIVTVTCNPLTRVVVSLAAEDTWGSAEVDPSSILFSSSGEQPFGVSVRARERESTKNTGIVTVIGRWTMYPGSLTGPAQPQEGVQGRINIAQFFKFTTKSPKAFIETKPGENVDFQLIICNTGNGMDEFSVTVLNSDDLSNQGFKISLSESQISIPENPAEGTINISVDISSSVSVIGYHKLEVEVKSLNSDESGDGPVVQNFVIKIPEENIATTIEFSVIIIIIILVVALVLLQYFKKVKAGKDSESIQK
jgi:hypothetical protein